MFKISMSSWWSNKGLTSRIAISFLLLLLSALTELVTKVYGVANSIIPISNHSLKSEQTQGGYMNMLRQERQKQGLSQTLLSAKTLIAASDLSAIENGRKVPHRGWRKRIAKALKVNEQALFGERK